VSVETTDRLFIRQRKKFHVSCRKTVSTSIDILEEIIKKRVCLCVSVECVVCVPFGVSRHLEDSCFFPPHSYPDGVDSDGWVGQQFETTTQKGGKERKKNWLFHSSRGSLLKHFFFFDKVIERKGKQ
jgi:hypothetical protein